MLVLKLDGEAPLVACPAPANITTDTDTPPISDTMVNIFFGCTEQVRKMRSYLTRQGCPIDDRPSPD